MKLPLTTNLKSDKEKESETMKEALKHIINDAYERGKLDAELGVSTNLSLFVQCAAAQILGTMDSNFARAKNIPDGSIVELNDGRIGVLHKRWERKGFVLVKVYPDLGVEVRGNDRLIALKYPHMLSGQLVEALVAKHQAA